MMIPELPMERKIIIHQEKEVVAIHTPIWISCLIIGLIFRKMNMNVIIFSLVVCLFYACSFNCEDCEQSVILEPSEIKNATDIDVVVSFVGEDSLSVNVKGNTTFFFNDTAFSALIPRCDCGLFLDGCNSKPIDVYLKFLYDIPQCVAFKGDILDESTDIRSIKSYEKIGEYSYVGAIMYYYRFSIDSTIVKKAILCD